MPITLQTQTTEIHLEHVNDFDGSTREHQQAISGQHQWPEKGKVEGNTG
jgi:hypothetical protein